MKKTKSYKVTIDVARLVAAVLVVAIHTAPFSEVSEPLSFFITNVLGRFAVPFFFILTGYFLFKKIDDRPPHYKDEQVTKTLISLLKTYGLAVLLYTPVWLYINGFQAIASYPMDLLWNGIHYHLWYFIASIVGLIIGYLFYKFSTVKVSAIVFIILYVFGSLINVYGPLLPSALYSSVTNLIGNPRNGIFFAPLFIFIGQLLARRLYKVKPIVLISALIIYMIEPFIVYFGGFADPLNSMYLTLPLVMFVLMSQLLVMRSETHESTFFHNVSLHVYVIHPIVILGNRLVIGKILNQNLSNTLNFVLALVLSLLASYAYYLGRRMIDEKNK